MNWMTPAMAIGLVALVSCNKPQTQGQGDGQLTEAVTAATTIPAEIFVAEIESEAQEVRQAKDSVAAGDRIIVTGQIAGRAEPIIAGRAMFTLVDKSIPDCSAKADDHCPTPWDMCCESKADIAANAATVQIVDDAGAVIKAQLNGVGGVAPGKYVTIQGAVVTNDEAIFVINASQIQVHQ